jgi:acyl-CoA thioesterase
MSDLFSSLTNHRRVDDGRYEFEFGEAASIWSVNGGYLAAAALRLAGTVGSKTTPVSLAAHFLRPVRTGPAFGRCEAINNGSSAELAAVHISQNDRACASVHVSSIATKEGVEQRLARMPMVPHPEEIRPLEELIKPGEAPPTRFWAMFDQRPINRSRDTIRRFLDPRYLRWFRYREDLPYSDAYLNASLALPVIDTAGMIAAWQSGNKALRSVRAPTMSLFVNFFEQNVAPGWMLCDARSDYAANGVISTHVEIWSVDGRLLSQGISQMVTIAAPKSERE